MEMTNEDLVSLKFNYASVTYTNPLLKHLHTGPGLNTMANHGYLPHNGVGAIQDFTTGTQAVFGMGKLPEYLPSTINSRLEF
jgi:hypothetical protein